MPQSSPEFNNERLNVDQRIELIGLLRYSLPDSPDGLPLPAWHCEELERRLAAADASPEAGIPWKQVKARLRGQG
jgi:putative addiction module component (TIGR02574 family)